MKLLNFGLILQLSWVCQAFLNGTTSVPPNVQGSTGGTNTTVAKQENFYTQPLVRELGSRCNWTLRMPGNESGTAVPLSASSADALIQRICRELDCGAVYEVKQTRAPSNASCFHDCVYSNGSLQKCLQSEESECTVIHNVTCGHTIVRLVGGVDRCAGRVELWKDGSWGTVCDDQWDLREAGVVCAQLGCGYALNVTGQGGLFPPGRGPIHLDDLNCTGREKDLWACPAAQDESDCGHKEDAGVVCSEMKDLRLTGGLDRCSGVLEIHRNGSWGTVCDNCWYGHVASTVCSMLNCGTPALKYSQFDPPLEHNNDTLYYYACQSKVQSLWQCKELINHPFICKDSKASGVICNGSLGFPVVSTQNVTTVSTTGVPTTVTTTEAFSPSPELLSTIALSVVLLVVLVINAVFCCLCRRRHASLFQQVRSGAQRPSSDYHSNKYEGAVDLVKVTTSPVQTDAPPNPRTLWNQLSSVDSTSVDTDYEQYDPSSEPSAALSTFRNSQRYRTETNPLMKPSGLGSLCEEVPEPTPQATGGFSGYAADPQYTRVSKISVDSFESSSTSSGECYENVENGNNGYIAVTPDPGPAPSAVENGFYDPSGFNAGGQHHFFSGPMTNLETSSDEDDGHLYSPVSPD